MESQINNKRLNKPKEVKKAYQTPELFVYGNIREITKNLGPKGVDDNGGGAGAGPKTGV